MAITTDLSTDIGKIRFAIGDDILSSGVLPNGANLTDDQITYSLTECGLSVLAAAAFICGSIARRWSNIPQSFSSDGLSINRGDVVAQWVDMQKKLEKQAGGGGFGTVDLDKQDAYSALWNQGGNSINRQEVSPYSTNQY